MCMTQVLTEIDAREARCAASPENSEHARELKRGQMVFLIDCRFFNAAYLALVVGVGAGSGILCFVQLHTFR